MTMTDLLEDTYVAALQHDLVDVSMEATLVGVVRRPTGWFRTTIDENYPVLGPRQPSSTSSNSTTRMALVEVSETA